MELTTSQLTNADDFIIGDADYLHTKARLCFKLANRAKEGAAKAALVRLGHAFEEKAWELCGEKI
jgi:hypothetical protein